MANKAAEKMRGETLVAIAGVELAIEDAGDLTALCERTGEALKLIHMRICLIEDGVTLTESHPPPYERGRPDNPI